LLGSLTDFEPVWVDVSALNKQGWGKPAARVRMESKPAVPAPLDDVLVAATADGFKVSWNDEVYGAGYPIRRFVVRVTSDSAGQTVIGGCSTSPPESSCLVTGLPAGTYAFLWVAAVNTVGAGEPVLLEATVPFS